MVKYRILYTEESMAMDAARRAVLEGRDDVATETLIEAVTRRRNLQRLGQDIGRQDSPPHRSE